MSTASPPPAPSSTGLHPTPPISRGGARAAILSRLAAQGRSPDFLDEGAVSSLIDHARGSPRTLRAAVDSTLALAAREGVAFGDAALVGRALGSASASSRIVVPARTRRALWLAGSGFAAAAVLLIFLAPLRPARVALAPAIVAPQAEPARAEPARVPDVQPDAPSPAAAVGALPPAPLSQSGLPQSPVASEQATVASAPPPAPQAASAAPQPDTPAIGPPASEQAPPARADLPVSPPPTSQGTAPSVPSPAPAADDSASLPAAAPAAQNVGPAPQPSPSAKADLPVSPAPVPTPAPAAAAPAEPVASPQAAPVTPPQPTPAAQSSAPASPPASPRVASVPPLAPDVGVAAPPVPAAPVAAEPPTALVLYEAGAPGVQQRLNSLSARLRQAGIGQIDKRAVPAGTALGRPVSFFDRGDLALAQRAAGVLASEGWPNLPVDELAPRMIRSRAALRQHHVVIEIQLP